MKRKPLAVLVFLFFTLFVPFVFWCGGYDFNARGEIAVFLAILTALLSIGGAVAVATYPED